MDEQGPFRLLARSGAESVVDLAAGRNPRNEIFDRDGAGPRGAQMSQRIVVEDNGY